MSLRWAECDELIPEEPIEALLCRTSKLNDASHKHDLLFVRVLEDIKSLQGKVKLFGYVSSLAALASVGLQIFKTIHG